MKKRILMSMIIVACAVFLFQGVTLAQVDLTAEQQLGKALYFDENLSRNFNQSCASCHDPGFGFVDPDNVENGTPVSAGSVAVLSGGLNAPSAAYAAFSPFFFWDGVAGLYVGGQFWNGRANTLAEQAAGPFLNPVEMAMPNEWAVVDRLKPSYNQMFLDVYGLDLESISVYDSAALTPPGVYAIYDSMAKAIGEFEKTELFTKFDSKFDYYLAGLTTLTKQEEKGFKLFSIKGKCALCHLPDPTLASDTVSKIPPLFTDFTYDNLGVPQNVKAGLPIDQGLGAREDIAVKDPLGLQLGKHKVV